MLQSWVDYWTSIPTPTEWRILKSIYATVWLAWGAMWATVAFHYFRASYSSWLEQHGRFRDSPKDFSDPVFYAYRRCGRVCRSAGSWIWCLVSPGHKRYDFVEENMPQRFTVGHYLRFSIFMGAITPAILGFLLFDFDRQDMERWVSLVNLTGVFISLCAASGHLFIAFNAKPASWMRFVVAASVWAIVSPFVFIFLNWP